MAAAIGITPEQVRAVLSKSQVEIRTASIREMNKLVDSIEHKLSVRFVRMEFGIPGLPTPEIAIDAEVEALRSGRVTHVYAPFEGLPALKEEAARFAKLFMNIDVPASSCLPTIGAMEGCYAALAVASRMHRDRRRVIPIPTP